MTKYRIKNDFNSDTKTSILIPEKIRLCESGIKCNFKEDLVYVIDGDPGRIGFCLDCIFHINKKTVTYVNGKQFDIQKELEKTANKPENWSEDALDEEIFECEQTMIYEYTNHGRGRKRLVKYWQKLQDLRECPK